jgi:predicted dehydrogenase
MADKVRIGVIGTGQIGKRHVQRYSEIPEAELVALCDIRGDEVARVAQMHDVSSIYLDYHELLARDDIQSVDVCLHNRLHAPVTIDALEAGKNVYCEKPMSWAYGEAKAMYDAAKRLGRKLHIQLGRIYRPETRAAKRLIDEGHLGRIYYAKCNSYRRRGRPFVDGYGTKEFVNKETSGGGTMLDTAVYDISRMMYLLDCPAVLSVSGSTYQETDMYEDRRESSGYNVEELGIGFARLTGGITFFLESSWAIHAKPPDGDQIVGSKGGVRLDPFSYSTTLADMEMDGTFDVDRADWRWHAVDPLLEGYDNSQKHWVWAQLGRVPLLDTAAFALRTAQITEGVYLSAHLGHEVTADEIEAAPVGTGR